ncbi:potassium channel family protein [Croceicoccus naphthovorans]|uniref:Potassium transporter n=1 Tax=Croceicoccus naphthovorans TaxID=1348774 RepID=A0A0G3XC29_9SPHN|nr:TrkA family potassium uptake protein [Croceicoccus naphthovorans]AKM09085.1 potassium transporter [Croceicoccus naphthovorans]MBB3991674.1 trk system potassium uptake protein TrkA [Croceicoccus naphthovorans]
MARKPKNKFSPATVAVIGLGRFGSAVAHSLLRMGHDVLAIDCEEKRIQACAAELPHVLQADTTDIDTLRQIGLADFQRVVVGIGSDVEASILTVMGLTDLEIPQIWAKAIDKTHGRILERVGAHNVVYPEERMGNRVARLVTGKMIDHIEFDEDFSIIKTKAPEALVGSLLGIVDTMSKFGVAVIGVKPQDGPFRHITEDIVVQAHDLLIVAGSNDKCEAFAALE